MKKKKSVKTFLLYSTLFLLINPITSQIEIEWEKNFGGSELDKTTSIQQTIDSGYIIAGFSTSNDGDISQNFGEGDFWILKLTHSGSLEWEKNFGGTNGDGANSIQETTDGGFIISGNSSSIDEDVTGNYGDGDYWVIKLNENGDLIWEKNFGGSESDFSRFIQQTTDGGYIIMGDSNSNDGDVGANYGKRDYWIIKLNEDGNLIWEKNFGGSDNEYAYSIKQTMDNGYIAAGTSMSDDGDVGANYGLRDIWIIKLDEDGNLIWEKNFGGSDFEAAYSIQQTFDGGYIVAGVTQSNDGDVDNLIGGWDAWIFKLDENGNLIWEKTYGGTHVEEANSIIQTPDGAYVFTGNAASVDGHLDGNNGDSGYDYWIVKLDQSGEFLWGNNFGGSNSDEARSIQQTMDGGYIVAGDSDSNDGDVGANYGNCDYWVVKFSPDITNVNNFKNKVQINLQPNPSNGNIFISLEEINETVNVEVFDILGHQIYSGKKHSRQFEINNMSNGVYWINIEGDDFSMSKKFIVH